MPLYSHSQLSTYQNCPLHYKFRYRDRIKRDVTTVEAYLGTVVHATLEQCYKDVKRGKKVELQELLSFYEQAWDKGWHDGIVIVRQDCGEEDYRMQGRRMLSGYYQRYAPFNQDITIGTEVRLQFNLDGDPKYPFIGFVDRLSRAADEVYEIQDYKTGGTLPTQADLDADRQLAIYQYGVQQRWPDFNAVRLVWHYLAFDERLVSTRRPEDIEHLIAETRGLIDEVSAAQDFPAIESALCAWCEYPDLCPKRRHQTVVAELPAEETPNETGFDLVNRYAALKAQAGEINAALEQVKQALIDYASRENLEIVGGSEYRVRVKSETRHKLPGKGEAARDEIEQLLRTAGQWDAVSQLDGSALLHALDEAGWDDALTQRLRGYLTEEESHSVYLSKLKDEA